MNQKNYEQIAIQRNMINAPKYLKEGSIVDIMFHAEDEKPLSCTLPPNVNLKIINANSDILKGVTRTSLLKIIKKTSLKLIEKQFTHKQLINADEVFLTSSGSFITPILKIDNKKINSGKIGNITLQLAEMYTEACVNG